MGYYKNLHTGWGRVSDYMWTDTDRDLMSPRESERRLGLASGWQPTQRKRKKVVVDAPTRWARFDPDNDCILSIEGEEYDTLFFSHEMAMAYIQANELELTI